MKRPILILLLLAGAALLLSALYENAPAPPAVEPSRPSPVTKGEPAEKPAREIEAPSASGTKPAPPASAPAATAVADRAAGQTPPSQVPPTGSAQTPHTPARSRYGARTAFSPPAWPFRNLERVLQRKLSDNELDKTLRELRPPDITPYVHSSLPVVDFKPTTAQTPGGGPTPGGMPAPPPPSSSPPATEPVPLDRLFGKFDGDIRFDQGNLVWTVGWELAGRVADDKLTGVSSFELTNNGQTITKTTQTGELTSVKRLANESVAILLVPSDKYAFQLEYVPDRDVFGGTFYEKGSDGAFHEKGLVRLGRRAAVSPRHPNAR